MSDVQTVAPNDCACAENSCGEIYQYVKNYSYKTMTIAEAENFFR